MVRVLRFPSNKTHRRLWLSPHGGIFYLSGPGQTIKIRMKPEEIRALQAPLKARYRSEPNSAMVTLRADGNLTEGISCSVATGQALVKAGLHPATGGTGQLACSGDMLLQALVACAGVTMNAVATALGISLQAGSLTAEGDLDFRGTLGVSKETPVGFQSIRLTARIQSNASPDELAKLIELTERYCVVYQTLRGNPRLDISLETVRPPGG